MSEKKKTVYRDSESGQFTTERYSDRHPSTTEKERVWVAPPPPSKPPKK
jgi:hypothetical protein